MIVIASFEKAALWLIQTVMVLVWDLNLRSTTGPASQTAQGTNQACWAEGPAKTRRTSPPVKELVDSKVPYPSRAHPQTTVTAVGRIIADGMEERSCVKLC